MGIETYVVCEVNEVSYYIFSLDDGMKMLEW
jgi:hypothetical protein